MSSALKSTAGPTTATLSARDFQWFSELVYSVSGIVLSEQKSQLVSSRLAKRMRTTGCSDFGRYMALVANDAAERDAAVYALTTNHTKFFREDHHFEHFAANVWPALAGRLRSGGKVRLWSAACSSGEEPYSLLMTAAGGQRREAQALFDGDFKVLATDLAPHVLQIARTGQYPVEILSAIPKGLGAAWVRRSGNYCEIDLALRKSVAFRQLNLLGDWPMRGAFDAIFCRNVMIYFDEPTKARLQERLASSLAPGGYLYIGHSERLTGPAERLLTPIGHTIYRKVAT